MSAAELSATDQSIARRSRPSPYDAPLTRILMLLCACYGATIAALYWIGVQPVVPWSLLLVFVLVVIPFALGAAGAVTLVVGHQAYGNAMARGRCMLLGAMFMAAFRLDSPLFLLGQLVLLPVVVRRLWHSGLVRPLTLMAGVLMVGYATIWSGTSTI